MERRRREPRCAARAAAALGLALAVGACASGSPAPAPGEAAPPAASADPEARMRALEESIARDEERVRALLAQEPGAGAGALLDSDELREIARRLPAQQAELERLRQERAQRGEP
jgi:hypothetical protein